MEGASQRRAKQGFCTQPFLTRCRKKNAGLSCAARAASSTSAPQKKNSRTSKGALRGTCQGRANFRDARGRAMPWKLMIIIIVVITENATEFIELHKKTHVGALRTYFFQWLPKATSAQREAQSLHHKSKAPPQRVYLQRSSLPTRDDACRGPLCHPESIPAEVLSAHPR